MLPVETRIEMDVRGVLRAPGELQLTERVRVESLRADDLPMAPVVAVGADLGRAALPLLRPVLLAETDAVGNPSRALRAELLYGPTGRVHPSGRNRRTGPNGTERVPIVPVRPDGPQEEKLLYFRYLTAVRPCALIRENMEPTQEETMEQQEQEQQQHAHTADRLRDLAEVVRTVGLSSAAEAFDIDRAAAEAEIIAALERAADQIDRKES